MVRSNPEQPVIRPILFLALFSLGSGLLFGCAGALQYACPGLLRDQLSFEQVRPLHVSSVLVWILAGSAGVVLWYYQQHTGNGKPFRFLSIGFSVGMWIFFSSVWIAYFFGHFGGKEYWEFPPVLSCTLVLAWLCLAAVFFKNLTALPAQPVYVWMWMTGIVFFLFTLGESYLWLLPYFRNHVVNDMTIQWKANGSLVGSWNMLLYGSSLYYMEKVSGDQAYAHSNTAFWLYFIGLTNLLFNWGHHIYTLPTHAYVKHISYIISMTELILLARIIRDWKKNLAIQKQYTHLLSFLCIQAAERWIFLNLSLAILLSIPAVNLYTHGTHFTVAHAMGATIGINTFLLLGFFFHLLTPSTLTPVSQQRIRHVIQTAQFMLLLFWVSLIGAGVLKSYWQFTLPHTPYSKLMQESHPVFISLFISGALLACSLLALITYLIRWLLATCFLTENLPDMHHERIAGE